MPKYNMGGGGNVKKTSMQNEFYEKRVIMYYIYGVLNLIVVTDFYLYL